MSKKLGNIEYNSGEYLNYGANYEEPETQAPYAGIAELHIIDLKEKEDNDIYLEEQNEESSINEEERIEDSVLEARFVAKK